MGEVRTHNFTWRDSGTPTTLGIYLPDSYTPGRAQRWLILHSGGGGTWQIGVTEARFQALCNRYDLAMVTATQSTEGDSAEYWSGWNGAVVERDHEEQMISIAQGMVPELTNYLPSIMGASMGGLCSLRALLNHPERYSACGAFCAVWDAIYWDASRGLNGASSPFDVAYPGTPAQNEWWLMDSPGHRIATADLMGRKIVTTHGNADTVISYADVWNPSIAAIPPANLHGAYLINNGGHDWGLFAEEAGTTYHGDEVFAWFASEAIYVPQVSAVPDSDIQMRTATGWRDAHALFKVPEGWV